MVEVPLGKLRVRFKSPEPELHVTSTITCAASEKAELEQLEQRLTSSVLNDSSSYSPYLHCNNSLSFDVSLHLDVGLPQDEFNALIESFSAQLRTATLWRQLHFSQPSVRTPPIENGEARIELTLTRSEETSEQSCRSPHKLSAGVPFYDVKPPSGTPTGTLERVVLHMSIRSHVQAALDTTKPLLGSQQTIDELRVRMALEAPLTSLDDDDTDEVLLDDSQHIEEDLFDHNSLDESAEADDLTAPTLLDTEVPNSLDVEQLLTLLDVGFRRAMSKSAPLVKKISVQRSTDFRSLASIAPALFRTGHLPNVAIRAVFMPTVSRSLSTVSLRRTKSERPKKGAEDTITSSGHQSQFTCGTIGAVPNTQSYRCERQTCLLQFLWSLTERHLLDTLPEKRLNPLSGSSTSVEVTDLSERLLGDSNVEADESMAGNEDMMFDFQGGFSSDGEDIFADDSISSGIDDALDIDDWDFEDGAEGLSAY